MFNVRCFYFLSLVAIRGVDLLPHVENFLGARGKKFFRVWAPSPSFILTMQRYNILIAVHEYLPDFFQTNHTVTMVTVKMVKIELRCAINAQ
jgi:hypothetical protein